ncbi:RHS repeat-associated core domain-containing protein [Lentisphaerota bacterium WC36G]|nr:hypothetical protein LJT99_09555 [Lentisphaerae bacterium WC36]
MANKYDYSPFGQLAKTDENVENVFKFSSEYAEKETGLIYYNYRYYNPSTGKWLKRDPIQEKGGENIYGNSYNNPIVFYDILGLRTEMSLEDYLKKYFDAHPKFKENPGNIIYAPWVRKQINRGCVGVVCANTGVIENHDNCYKTKQQATDAQGEMKNKCKDKVCPKMFSVHFWNDKGKDGINPDVTFDPKTGKADFSNWDKEGMDEDSIKFDYGYVNPDGSITHADQYHNPDIDDDGTGDYHPDYPIRSGTIYESTEEEWKESYADFNSEAWCIQCSNPTFKSKGKTCSNY